MTGEHVFSMAKPTIIDLEKVSPEEIVSLEEVPPEEPDDLEDVTQ